jgi:hypothetical protein
MPVRKHSSDIVSHVHDFRIMGQNITEERCKCGAILISQSECDRRVEEWQNYLSLVRHSKSYQHFRWMQSAYKQKNMRKVEEIRKVISSRCRMNDDGSFDFDEDAYILVKPNFPDPSVSNSYIISQRPTYRA